MRAASASRARGVDHRLLGEGIVDGAALVVDGVARGGRAVADRARRDVGKFLRGLGGADPAFRSIFRGFADAEEFFVEDRGCKPCAVLDVLQGGAEAVGRVAQGFVEGAQLFSRGVADDAQRFAVDGRARPSRRCCSSWS